MPNEKMRDCNTCKHHVQAGPIPKDCRDCLTITANTFGEATRLPLWEPKEEKRMAIKVTPCVDFRAPAAFVEFDPVTEGRGLERPAVDRKDTNPKDSVGIRKAPLSTVPMNVVAEAGVAMLEGALKYGRHNYRAMGIRESVYFDGTMRHLLAYWEGEDIDPDSGVSHLTKAIASLLVWRDAQMNGNATDDRPPKAKAFYPDLNARAARLVDAAPQPAPKHHTAL